MSCSLLNHRFDLILIRYGETFLKKGKRGYFIHTLKQNLKTKLGKGFDVKEIYGFLIVTSNDGLFLDDQLYQILTTTFGIQSFSVGFHLPLDISKIEEFLKNEIKEFLKDKKSFRISAHRSFKGFPLNSMELNRRLGEVVFESTSLSVDLHNPDINIGVLIHKSGCYVYLDTCKGAGGLPVGTAGRGGLLLSGGIDSPVAGLLMLKRGLEITPITFQCDASGDEGIDKVKSLAKQLSNYHLLDELFVLKTDDFMEAAKGAVPQDLRLVLIRRFMLRLATRIVQAKKGLAVVTGDSLAQVASQTLENLSTISAATNMLVLRPLVGMDKDEVINLAKHFGTYDISIEPAKDCCSLFAPRHPQTRSTLDMVNRAESKLDLFEIERNTLKKLRVYSLNGNDTTNILMTLYWRMRLLFGHRNWWPAEDTFEVVVGAVLTQNTAWKNVERAIVNLKQMNLLSPLAILNAPDEVLHEALRPAGYFKIKTKRLKNVVKLLVELGGEEVDRGNFRRLQKLPGRVFREKLLDVNGVGPETADSILLYAFNKPYFVIDAYTRRIFQRMKLIKGDESYEELQKFIQDNIPYDIDLYNDFHAQLVNLAKDFCHKNKPVCNDCPVRDLCFFNNF